MQLIHERPKTLLHGICQNVNKFTETPEICSQDWVASTGCVPSLTSAICINDTQTRSAASQNDLLSIGVGKFASSDLFRFGHLLCISVSLSLLALF